MGCAINVIQTPLRAIIADVAPESQQELGQSISSVWQAVGGIVGFLVAYIWNPLSIMRPYFVASAVALVVTTAIACVVAHEVSHVTLSLLVWHTCAPHVADLCRVCCRNGTSMLCLRRVAAVPPPVSFRMCLWASRRCHPACGVFASCSLPRGRRGLRTTPTGRPGWGRTFTAG